MSKVKRRIQQYLHFGYLPDPESALSLTGQGKPGRNNGIAGLPEKELIRLGAVKLKKAFADTIAEIETPVQHLVPLSGGLDSRAILAFLQEHTQSSNITAIVFGVPGTYDFIIGQQTAVAAGVRCLRVNLDEIVWNQDELIACAAGVGRPLPLFETFLFSRMTKFFTSSSSCWSGFMGDPLSGSHLPVKESKSWGEALLKFCDRERFAASIKLNPAEFRPEALLPEKPWLDPGFLTLDEQLDFNLRQLDYIKPLVLFGCDDTKTPFLHPDWVNFILGVPNRYRHRQELYKKILLEVYPRLFALPTKTNFGLPLQVPGWRLKTRKAALRLRAMARRFLPDQPENISPMINYIDFNAALRRREDLKRVVYENIMDLKHRRIVDWVDIDNLWHQHQKGQGNYADALTLLASLEILLKVKKDTLFSAKQFPADEILSPCKRRA
ncbi:MAG: hypothetical protein DRH03_05405 [Deltaproteobacteria bacterium]|nr:MAG: hypothetical protein DRH03_05405 [Deltaproteobacteria bacterium]